MTGDRSSASGPTLLLHNANIMTFDETQPRATTIVLAGERIVAVGDDGLKDAATIALAGRRDWQQDTFLMHITIDEISAPAGKGAVRD